MVRKQLKRRFRFIDDSINKQPAENTEKDGLDSFREKLLTGILITLAVMSAPSVIIGLYKLFVSGVWTMSPIYIFVWVLCLIGSLGNRYFSFTSRRFTLLASILLFAMIILSRYGLSGAGIWMLILLCLLATILYGIKEGIIALFFSLTVIGLIGLAMSTGYFPFDPDVPMNSTSGLSWILGGSVFLFIAIIAIFSPGLMLREIQSQLKMLKDQSEAQNDTNKRLHQEINVRTTTETALRESESKYRTIVNNTAMGIAIRNKNLTLVQCNPAYSKMLGYTEQELKQLEQFAITNEMDVDQTRNAMAAILNGSVHRLNYEKRYLCKNGREMWGDVSATAIQDEHGNSEYVLGTVVDITERKIAEQKKQDIEQQLLQALKLEAVGRLAGGIAHDFNNLLTGITGNLELAALDLSEEHALHDNLSVALSAAKRAGDLTRQLLAFSRKQVIEPKNVDLSKIVSNLKIMLSRLIGEDIEFTFEPGSAPCMVLGDPSQLEQIIINIVVNARDAMPQGGKLAIRTSFENVRDNGDKPAPNLAPGKYVLMTFEDSGHGMGTDTQKKIFEPFFTTKPVGQGTGLGLSTVYGIVSQSKGAVIVNSRLGEGTTFKIYLLYQNLPADDSAETPKLASNYSGSETILIVEDEPIVRNMARDILVRYGYRVLVAPDGKEALSFCKDFDDPIHLLLTDVVMPGMNGRVLAENLSKVKQGLKILFTSGYTDDVILRQGAMTDSIRFLPKPYSPATLAQKVRTILDEIG